MAGRHPQVLMVDGGHGRQAHPQQYPPRMDPGLVPCWTFPPAREKRRTCCSNSSLVTVLVMLLALVFAALGLGAYQIQRLQNQLKGLTEDMNSGSIGIAPQGQIGFREDIKHRPVDRLAAHLTVNTHKPANHKTLQWESRHDRAFTEGVLYRDGGLQVNRTSLYFVYSRVEILDNECKRIMNFLHTVFRRREGFTPTTLMEAHKEGFCKQTGKQPNYKLAPDQGTRQVWTSDSYLGAVLELKERDWIYVNVSHPDLISHGSPAGNYFGLYQIV
ncbi:hypothetical protein ACEWY4_014032 [Coilia grayii]|uniref:THD domain-containing protein n=1 Tax=Coilia grayii TaxID=363190 RepID=A0ABD1JR79_9TELE